MAHENFAATPATFIIAIKVLALLGAAIPAAAQAPAAYVNQSEAPVVHNTWTTGAPMPTARQCAAAGVIGVHIFVIGGVTDTEFVTVNEIYNTQTNTWKTGAPIPTATCTAASAVINGIVYVIGGGNSAGELDLVQAYDPATNTWSTMAPMPTARLGASAVVENNLVYVIGGYNGSRLATVESFDPATNTWKEEAPLLVGKSSPAVGRVGTAIVAAGGFDNAGATGDNEGYSATKNKWGTLTADPTPRQAGCAWGIAGLLYFAGGSPNDGDTDPVSLLETYNPQTKSWTTLASMPQPVSNPGSASIGGRLFCIGGGNNVALQGSVYDNTQIYQP